jgi:histidine triad (HIT) family protein
MFNHEPPGYICPFCLVVAGGEEPPAITRQTEFVVRGELVTAFIASDWRENNPGHVLVIPNQHIENVYDLPSEIGGKIQDVVRRVAIAMKRAYCCDGVSTVQHNEPGGNQHVWHYHVHVFPRYENDDIYRSPKRETEAGERAEYAAKLRDAIDA